MDLPFCLEVAACRMKTAEPFLLRGIKLSGSRTGMTNFSCKIGTPIGKARNINQLVYLTVQRPGIFGI